MSTGDVRELIDTLLAAQKSIGGTPSWHLGPRTGQAKWKAPLAYKGEIIEMDFILVAYPQMPSPQFMIMLTFQDVALCRLDYGENEEHNNGSDVPMGIPRWKIRGPHIHRWQDNRGLATRAALPGTLEYAIVIPSAARGFANVFRWFCGEHVVKCEEVPEYPSTDLLL